MWELNLKIFFMFINYILIPFKVLLKIVRCTFVSNIRGEFLRIVQNFPLVAYFTTLLK
jgi:hypothetical protein